MGKRGREKIREGRREEKHRALQRGSKTPQSVLAEQIETITVRGIFSLVFSLSTSSVMKWMNALTREMQALPSSASVPVASWIVLGFRNYVYEGDSD